MANGPTGHRLLKTAHPLRADEPSRRNRTLPLGPPARAACARSDGRGAPDGAAPASTQRDRDGREANRNSVCGRAGPVPRLLRRAQQCEEVVIAEQRPEDEERPEHERGGVLAAQVEEDPGESEVEARDLSLPAADVRPAGGACEPARSRTLDDDRGHQEAGNPEVERVLEGEDAGHRGLTFSSSVNRQCRWGLGRPSWTCT